MPQILEPTLEQPLETVTADTEIRQQRARAEAVLESLIQARDVCDDQSRTLNRPDMYRTVTGRSAMDAAIQSTRRIIQQLDEALARLEGDPVVITARSRPRRPLQC